MKKMIWLVIVIFIVSPVSVVLVKAGDVGSKLSSSQQREAQKKLKQVTELVMEGKITIDQVQQMIMESSNAFPRAEKVKQVDGVIVSRDLTEVNYNMPLKDLIEQGDYKKVDAEINSKHFATTRAGKVGVAVEVVSCGDILTSSGVLTCIKASAYRPADIYEMLAYTAQHPDEKLDGPIVCLGSVWQTSAGGWKVVSLRNYKKSKSKREMVITDFSEEWPRGTRFASVRE